MHRAGAYGIRRTRYLHLNTHPTTTFVATLHGPDKLASIEARTPLERP
jgi:hypothetical protein